MATQHTVTLPTPDTAEEVILDASGALFWPRGRVLFIADPHFGKAASFHQAGLAVPATLTAADLARLDTLLACTGASHLIVLGDFFHARPGSRGPTHEALAAWRAARPDLEIDVVRGNHDRHAGPPDDSLRIRTVDAPYTLPPFVLHHEPVEAPALDGLANGGYRLAGHLHPRVVLHDVDGSSVRLPCFWVGPGQMVLPAFGSFTGGLTIRPRLGDRVFVTAGGAIFEARLAAHR